MGIGKPWKAVALVAVGAAGGGAAIAVGSVEDSNGVIHACVQTLNGEPVTAAANVRVIDPNATPPQTCQSPAGAPTAESISWNVAGPTGATGATGPTGPQGPAGHTLTLNNQTFTISGINRTATIIGSPLIAPLPVNPGGRPVGALTGLDLGGGSPTIIEVSSWSFGASLNSSASGRGGGEGKTNVHEIQISKTVDKASPLLFKACVNGKHFPKATLTVRKAGGTQQPYLTITMKDVFVSSYQQSNGGGGKTTESFSLDFTKLEYTYTKQK